MAWSDILKDLLPADTNIFGASLPTYAKQAKEVGLLTQDAIDRANQQSMFTGLLGTAAAYFAQPKNQGYGSVLPYLAKAYGQGMQLAQNPYQQLGKELQYKKEFDEFARQEQIRKLQKGLIKPVTTTGEVIQPATANVTSAPIDASNPLGLQIAPNFTPPKVQQISETTSRVDPNVINEMLGIDLGAGANALTIQESFRKRDELNKSVNAINAFVEKYPKFEYLKDQPIAEALKFVNDANSASAYKSAGVNKFINVITGDVKTVPMEDITFEKGTFQKTGFAIDPATGDTYDIVFNTMNGKNTVTIGGKEVDLDSVRFNGQRPLIKSLSDLDMTQLSAGDMLKLESELTQKENSVRNLSRFLERNSQLTASGLPKYMQIIEKDMKMIFGQNKDLTPEQFVRELQAGNLQKLVGQNRLSIVGPGALTEQEAQRIMLALGGDPNAIMQNPLVAQALISEILADEYSLYNQAWNAHNIQTKTTGNRVYDSREKLKFSKSQIASMAPDVVVDKGFGQMADLTDSQLANFYLYNKQKFLDYLGSDNVSDNDRAKIWKTVTGKGK